MSSPLTRPTITYFAERGVRDGSSPSEAFTPDGSPSTRKFFVPWAQRFTAATAILGYTQIGYTGSTPDGLRRLLPLRHPDTSVFPYYWWAAGITKVEGHKFTGKRVGSDSSTANTFEKAEITVQYEQVNYYMWDESAVVIPGTSTPWIWPDDEWARYTSIGEIRTSTDYLQLPGGLLYYCRPSPSTDAPHNKPIPFNAGLILPIMEFPVTWKKIPYEIMSPYVDSPWRDRIWGDGTNPPYIGTVNKHDFLGYRAGTLLFSGIRLIERKSPFLVPEWDVEFTFAVDPRKWNYKAFIPPKADTEWLLVVKRNNDNTITHYAEGSIPDNKTLYNERDFTELFQVY